MQFEDYRWQDHVPRTGTWKFNLAAGAIAFGLVWAALPPVPDISSVAGMSAPPASGAGLSALEMRRNLPASYQSAEGQPSHCPSWYADS